MPAYFFNVPDAERQNILDQHKKPYDGLRTMGWESKNPQTLYIQDFANDKMGVTINSKGEVKEYTHTKIHEQLGIPYTKSPDLTSEFSEGEMCEQCGTGTMLEGMCNECGYKMEGISEDDMTLGDEVPSFDTEGNFLGMEKPNQDMETGDEVPSFDNEGNFLGMEKPNQDMEETTEGFDEKDLNPSAEFDYVGGADNDTDTYEGMDEDLVESVEGERSTIMEMFQRMRVIK